MAPYALKTAKSYPCKSLATFDPIPPEYRIGKVNGLIIFLPLLSRYLYTHFRLTLTLGMHVHMVYVHCVFFSFLLNACTTIKFGSMKWKIDSTSSIVAHIVRNCGKYLLFLLKGKL